LVIRTALFTEADRKRMVIRNAGLSAPGPVVRILPGGQPGIPRNGH